MNSFYSPPGGGYPQNLPLKWKFEDGTVKENLQNLSVQELNALGWAGPIEMPNANDYLTKDYKWNPNKKSFDIIELNSIEKEQKVSYDIFWDMLFIGKMINGSPSSESEFYKRIKNESKTSLEANILLTELTFLISDAKNGIIRKENIQKNINSILSLIEFTQDEISNLKDIFSLSRFFLVYTLPQ